MLRFGYHSNSKKYSYNKDWWHRSLLHCAPRFERYLSRG